MGSKSDYFEKKFLDNIFRAASLGLDATNVWVSLFTVTPSDSAAGTEVSGGSYARVAVVRTGAGWDAASGASPGQTANTGAVTFPTATADWGTVVAFGIHDASSAGNLLYWGALTANKTVSNGDTISFAAGTLTVGED